MDSIDSRDFKVTSGAIPGGRKVYFSGERNPSVQVPMREIALHPSAKEPAQVVYDTSGPYTDPNARIDIMAGLPRLRDPWVRARGDVEEYEGRTVKPEDNGRTSNLVAEFPAKRRPLRAKAGASVSQMEYARRGIVTPEMEYIAIR